MMKNNSLAEIAKQLNSYTTYGVICHVRPDGDTLGSGLALVTALKNAGKTAYLLCEDAAPDRLKIYDEMNDVCTQLPIEKEKFDAIVCVDCADMSRLGCFGATITKFKGATINIDHHISNTMYAKYNYVLECTATCELMCEVFEASGFEITTQIANFLALGLLTDSGNFSHKDVTAKTFLVASKLKEKQADISTINYLMFSRQTKPRAILYARVLNKMRFCLDDKLVFITITLKDLEETGADKSLTEGFVDFPLSIDGVEVSVSLMEVKPCQYKASLRSKGVNVNAVACQFGGGGHVMASGCMLFGEYEEVIEKLTYAIYQNL